MNGGALVVANRLPYPLDDGWKRRTFHIIRALAEVGPVTLVSLHGGAEAAVVRLADQLGPRVRIETVRPPRLAAPISLVLGLLTARPYHVWRQRSRALARCVRRVAARDRPDIALATLAHLYPYLRVLAPETVRIVDTHNIDSLVLRRYAALMWRGPRAAYARLTARKLETHERAVFLEADSVWVCSEAERAALSTMRAERIEVVPNGVDATGEFQPGTVSIRPDLLIFFGKLDYHPNRDATLHFLKEILPLIRAQRPSVDVEIVGPGADHELRAQAEAAGARLTGRAEHLGPVIERAAVVVVPLRAGGGTRLKILEALALGRPVVSTTIGVEGLELQDGKEIVLADSPADFAARVLDLLDDPTRAATIGAAGRAAVRECYDWSRIAERIHTLLHALRRD